MIVLHCRYDPEPNMLAAKNASPMLLKGYERYLTKILYKMFKM